MFQSKLVLLAVVSFVVSFSQLFGQTVVYFNDFESAVGSEWSNQITSVTPRGARRFLGEFGNTTVSLSIDNLPSHSIARISLDLFIIRSWDGNGGFPNGPDIWQLNLENGATLLNTTFSNTGANQSYPQQYLAGNNPLYTGAVEKKSLGYFFVHPDIGLQYEDAVYNLSFVFKHSASSYILNFSALGLQEILDESWGIDNVKIEIIGNSEDTCIAFDPTENGIEVLTSWASMFVPNGTYTATVATDINLGVNDGILSKVIIYNTTNNNPHRWFYVLENETPREIVISNIGLDANKVFGAIIDGSPADNSGSATVTLTNKNNGKSYNLNVEAKRNTVSPARFKPFTLPEGYYEISLYSTIDYYGGAIPMKKAVIFQESPGNPNGWLYEISDKEPLRFYSNNNQLFVGVIDRKISDNSGQGILRIVPSENQPPQITHAPITSVKKGEAIPFEFDVTDDKDQIETIEIWVRLGGMDIYTSNPVLAHNGFPHYFIEITNLTNTLAGVDYYIEAKDTEGASKTDGTAENPHQICITEQEKIPVIIIPGFMGSELVDSETNNIVWLERDADRLVDKMQQPCDSWLHQLLLQNDGITPDILSYCACGFNECNDGCGKYACAIGGRTIIASDVLSTPDIYILGGIKKIADAYDAYTSLIDYLVQNGYTRNVDLFTFPYDWRLDVDWNAELLRKEKIEKIVKTFCDKVNIIAHSTGGLVARSYFTKYKDDHRIDTIIYLGVPQLGTPKSYPILRGYTKLVSDKELVLSSINAGTMSFASQNFPCAYQLLPNYTFVTRIGVGGISLSETYATLPNSKLVEKAMEFQDSIKNFNPVQRSFAISGSGKATLTMFNVDTKGKTKEECIWAFSGNGDETVPQKSSSGLVGVTEYFVQGEHSVLPGLIIVQKKILKILQGKEDDPDDPNEVKTTPFAVGETWTWTSCCPINLEITDLEGNVNGVDKENNDIKQEIPESGFFSFPNNESGFMPHDNEYNIKIKAFKDGEFTLTLNLVEPDETISKTIEYANVPIGGKSLGELLLISGNNNPMLSLDVGGDGIPDFELVPNTNIPTELKNMFAQRGDINKDGDVDVSDGITILGFLFLGSKVDCANAGDTNKDGTMDISDAIYLLSFLFLGWEEVPQELVLCE